MKQKLLLDCCCGPCSTQSIEKIKDKYDITILFSNHNIHPIEEYYKRKQSQDVVVGHYSLDIITDDYLPDQWFDFVKGLENEPEKGKRCLKCFEYRLQVLKKYALKHDFNFVTTTLTISPYKNHNQIFKIANEIFKDTKIQFLEYNFNDDNGYHKSIKLSKELNLYRQKYCGCIYSINK